MLLSGAVVFAACDDDDANNETPQTTFTGEETSLGNGQVWSYVKTDDAGEPTAIGVQFTAAALNGLPTGHAHGHETVLALPDGISVPPYDHITVDWNENGHEPPGVYDLPHFDMHFYMMNASERDMILPTSENEFNKALPSEYLAPNYMETPGGVPRMGAHIIDLQSPEIAGTGSFTHTFIYGKFDGELNFLEPMFTKAYLESKPSLSQPIRQPQMWQKEGYYPQRYTISYDEASSRYTILLEGLTKY